MAERPAASPTRRFLLECSGACGDLGTFIPNVIRAMTVAGLAPAGVLFGFAAFLSSFRLLLITMPTASSCGVRHLANTNNGCRTFSRLTPSLNTAPRLSLRSRRQRPSVLPRRRLGTIPAFISHYRYLLAGPLAINPSRRGFPAVTKLTQAHQQIVVEKKETSLNSGVE